MPRAKSGLLAVALLAGSLVPSGSGAAGPSGEGFVPGHVLVRFTATSSVAARAEAVSSVAGTLGRRLGDTRFNLVRTSLPVSEAVARLSRSPAVAVAEPDVTGAIALSPNDPCVTGCSGGTQWNVAAVNAEAGWEVVPDRFYTSSQKKTLEPIRIAVLDTKIDVDQPDWVNASPLPVNHPYDSVNGGQLDMANAIDIVPPHRQEGSADYHGTFVAGILGAATHNGAGLAGLAYHAQMIPVTVVDGGGVVRASELVDGIGHARAAGARVINLSLGLHETSSAVQDAINIATGAGALVVAAAGNNGDNLPFYPAWHRNAMGVAALDRADRAGACSNHNAHISVAAPGVGILSMDPRAPNGFSVAGCGTSTAAPHVSALAALLFAQDPSRSPHEVRAIIERTADDDRFRAGRDDHFGHGRVNFERALRDGEGPVVDRVITTVPRALGGASRFTATAAAVSDRPIREAEWFVGALGGLGKGSPVFTDDGTFGGTSEALTVDIDIPIGFPTGVHRIFIRARDDLGWGPASVGVLIVDRTPPTISAYEVAPLAASTAGQPVTIDFEASDDYAVTLSYVYTVRSELTGQLVHTSDEATMSRSAHAEWIAPPELTGPYRVELTVRDDGGNPARARARTILL